MGPACSSEWATSRQQCSLQRAAPTIQRPGSTHASQCTTSGSHRFSQKAAVGNHWTCSEKCISPQTVSSLQAKHTTAQTRKHVHSAYPINHLKPSTQTSQCNTGQTCGALQTFMPGTSYQETSWDASIHSTACPRPEQHNTLKQQPCSICRQASASTSQLHSRQ